MRGLVCLLAFTSLACVNATICLAQPRPGPRRLEDLLESPGRPAVKPSKPSERNSDVRVPLIAPDVAAVKEAQDLIKQAYEDDYKTADKNPGPLIQKMLDAASDTKDPVRKYAFLMAAEEIAAAGKDYGRAMELIDKRAGEFAIDGLQPRIDRLKEFLEEFLATKGKTDPEVLVKLYDFAIETAERGVKQGSLDQSKKAADLADRIAKIISSAGKANKNRDFKDIERRAELLAEYQKALETLKVRPDDPPANGVIGRYLCFQGGDWDKGLPFLSKGENRDIADIATLEKGVFEGNKPDVRKVFDLAGKWWAEADGNDVPESVKTAIKAHAGELYESIWAGLNDPLDKALAQTRRRADIDTEAGVAPDRSGKLSTGLLGEYFVGNDFDVNKRKLRQVDKEIARDFDRDPVAEIQKDKFLVRWSGSIRPEKTDNYTFVGKSNDGIRMSVNGQMILNNWGRSGEFKSMQVWMQADEEYAIVIEYKKSGGRGYVFLEWQGQDVARERVPARCLYPPTNELKNPSKNELKTPF